MNLSRTELPQSGSEGEDEGKLRRRQTSSTAIVQWKDWIRF